MEQKKIKSTLHKLVAVFQCRFT